MKRTSEPSERDSLQRQARALGDPTRFRIFRLVADAAAPVRVATLTEQLGVNHSAVRQHLAKLCDAGLLIEEFAVGAGPGRPPLEYRLAPAASGAWGTKGPYEALSLLLLDILRGGESPREVGARAGRRAVGAATGDALELLVSEMARSGFQPRRVRRSSSVEIAFDNCPLEAAASFAPDIVCELHRGLADGMLESARPELRVRELVAHHPSRAGCRLKVQGVEG